MPVSGTLRRPSSCVEIETGGPEYVLCDLGTGVRPFGQQAMARHGPASPQSYHIFMSHVHWDHIMGFPFFTPAYIPGNRIRIYGGHAELEEALRRQQGRAVVSGGLFGAARGHRVRAPGAGHAIRHRRHCTVAPDAAAPRRRFVRLSLRVGRTDRRSTPPIPSTSSTDVAETDALRRVLSRCRRGHLRRDVLAGRRDVGQGRLGTFEQHRRRRAVPDGGGAASVPVPSRADARRRGDRPRARGNAAPRGDHAHRRAAAGHAPPTTGWKSPCERFGCGVDGADGIVATAASGPSVWSCSSRWRC